MAVNPKDFMSTQTGGEGATIQAEIQTQTPEQFQADINPQQQEEMPVQEPIVTEQPQDVSAQELQVKDIPLETSQPVLSEEDKIYSELGLTRPEIDIPEEEVVQEIEQPVASEEQEAETIELDKFTEDGLPLFNKSYQQTEQPSTIATDFINEEESIIDEEEPAGPTFITKTEDGLPIYSPSNDAKNKQETVRTEYSKAGVKIDVQGKVQVKDTPKDIYPTYKLPNSETVYQRRGDKWYKEMGKGNFVPLTKGDVKKRTEYLNNNAVLISKLGTGTKDLNRINSELQTRVGNLRSTDNSKILTAGGDPTVSQGLSFNSLTRSNIGGKNEKYNQDGTLNFNYNPNSANLPREAANIIEYKGKPDGVYKFPGSESTHKKENGSWYVKPKGGKEYIKITGKDADDRIANLEKAAKPLPVMKDAAKIFASMTEVPDPTKFDANKALTKFGTPYQDAFEKQEIYKQSFEEASNFASKDVRSLLGDNLSEEQKNGMIQFQDQLKEVIGDGEYDPLKASAVSKIMKDAEQFFDTSKEINTSINEAVQNGVSLSRLAYEKKKESYKRNVLIGKESEFQQSVVEMFEATSDMADFFIENTENGKIRYDVNAKQYVISNQLNSKERQYLETKMSGLLADYDKLQNEKYTAVNERIGVYKKSLNNINSNISKIERSMKDMANSGVKTNDPRYIELAKQLMKQRKAADYVSGSIDNAESLKGGLFLTEPKKMAANVAGVMSSDAEKIFKAIPSDITAKEKFDLFYDKLDAETRKLIRDNNLDEGKFSGINIVLKDALDWDGLYQLNDVEKKVARNLATLRQMSSAYYNNDMGITQESAGFFESFINSFAQALMPETAAAVGYYNKTEVAGKYLETFANEGITEEDLVTPEFLETINDRAVVGFDTAEKWGGMLGTTAGIVVPLMLTRKVPSTSLRVLSNVEKIVRADVQAGKTAGIVANAEKVYDAALSSSKVGRFLKPAIESGARFEIAGELTNQDELDWWSGLAGGVASELLTSVMTKLPKEQVYSYLNSFFGSKTSKVVDLMKTISDASARGIAETGEEFAQEITNIYRETDNFTGMMAELSNRFGSFDQVQEFIISSFVLGTGFGLVDGNQGKELLDKLPEEKRRQTIQAMSEINSALSDADNAVEEYVENKKNQEAVNKKIEEYDRQDQAGVSGEVTEGQKPVEEQPITEAGKETTSPSGVVQEEQAGERIIDRKPSIDDGEFYLDESTGDTNKYRINELTGRVQYLDETNGLWSNIGRGMAEDGVLRTAEKRGFKKAAQTEQVTPAEERVTATTAEEAKALWDQGYRPNIEGSETMGGRDAAIDNIFNTRKEIEMTRMVAPEANQEAKIVDDGVEAFHSTYADFDQFDANKSSENSRDFGFHFGSTDAAKKRAEDVAKSAKSKGEEIPDEATSKTIKARLNIKNPLRLSEDRIGDFSPISVLKRIFNSMDESGKLIDGFTQEEVDGFFNDDLQFNGSNILDTIGGAGNVDKQSEILREYLESKGYDGLVYKNEFEGGGDSYVAFRPDQVQIVEKKQTFGKPSDSESLMKEKENEYAITEDSLLGEERGAEINNILKSNVEDYSLGLLNSFEAYDQLPNSEKAKFTEEEKAKIENLRTIWSEIQAERQAEAETKQKGFEKLAETIRSKKLKPGWMTGGDSGIAMSTFGADKAFMTAWNGAIETIARAIEVSGKSAEAIQKAIDSGYKSFKKSDWYKSLNRAQKVQVAKEFNEEMNKIFPKPKVSASEKAKGKEFGEKISEVTGTAKPKKTVQRTESQALKDSIRDREKGWRMGQKNLQDIKEQIRDYAKQNLPMDDYSKKEVTSIMNSITNAKTPKGLEKALDRVDAMVNKKAEAKRKRTVRDVRKKASEKRTLFTKQGSKWIGKVSIEAQKEFLDFINSPAMSELESKTQEELDAINDVLDGIVEAGKADYKAVKRAEQKAKRERAANLIEGLAKKEKVTLNGIDQVQEWLDKGNVVIINGQLFRKSDLKELQNQKKILERRKKAKEKELEALNKNPLNDPEVNDIDSQILSIDDEISEAEAQIEELNKAIEETSINENVSFTGYKQGNMGMVRDASKAERAKWYKPKNWLRAINPTSAISDIYSLLKGAYASSSAVAKFVKNNIEKPIKKAYFDRMNAYGEKVSKYYNDVAEIFGSKKEAISYLSGTPSKNPITFKATAKTFPLTNGHMVDWYNLIRANENGMERMEKSNIDPNRVVEYIESDPKLKAYADYILNEYNTTLRSEYESTYQAYTNTSFGDGTYYPSYAEGFEENFMSEDEVMGADGMYNAMNATSRNLKQRVSYSGQFNTRLSAHEKFLDYIKTMEHAKHFMPIAKSANELFSKANAPYLLDYMGLSDYNDLKLHLGVILSNQPIQDYKGESESFTRFINSIRNFSVVATLGLKPASIVKQWSSFTHYWFAGIDSGIDPHKILMGAPKTSAEWDLISSLWNSQYMQDRLSGEGIDIELKKMVQQSLTSKSAEAWAKTSKFILSDVRYGDAAALFLGLGGGSMYGVAAYRRGLSMGMTEEEAKKYAYERFVEATESTQQTTREDYTSNVQREQLFRFMAMYRTGQMSATKKVVNGIRTLYQAHKITKSETKEARKEVISERDKAQAISDIVYFSTFGSLLFNAIASGSLYYMWASDTSDDERKRMWYDGFMDQIQSNMQGYGWKGYFADLVVNELRGKGWMNNISSEKFINNLAKQPSVLTEAAMREWPSLTDEQQIEWLQENDAERLFEGENQDQEFINFMNEYANGSFWSKMTEAEKDSFYKAIGAGNVNKIIKNIGEAIDDPSSASWVKAIMNYDDDYFEKAKEAGKRDLIYEMWTGEPYLIKEKGEKVSGEVPFPEPIEDINLEEDLGEKLD